MLLDHLMAIPNSKYVIVLDGADPITWVPRFSVRNINTGEIPPLLQASYATIAGAYADFMKHKSQLTRPGVGPEMDKMMTLSTAHISGATATLLQKEPEENNLCLSVYPKENYGWFLYIGGVPDDQIKKLPDDLRTLCQYAKANDCFVLCLDCDGPILTSLTTYEWDNSAPQLD